MRALAVFAVVAFHTRPDDVPGGFVGVDVFFVISGFLITGILIREAERDGRIRIMEFYARRVRRILPALLLVIAATLALGAVVLAPGEIGSLVGTAVAAAGFMVNELFRRRTGYFAHPAESEPLLHLWSLSVEEQFYLCVPVLAAMVMRVARRAPVRVRFGAWIACATVGSFALGLYLEATGRRDTAFYFMPARVWELGIGAMLAVPSERAWTRLPPVWVPVLAAGGLLAIVGSCLLLDRRSAIPGWPALAPTLGAAAVLAGGAARHAGASAALVTRALSARPVVWVGLVSYPWYLWHWPLLTMSRLRFGPNGLRDCLLSVAALGLAAATYRGVELPVRRRALRVLPPVGIVATGVAGLVLIAAAARIAELAVGAWRDAAPPEWVVASRAGLGSATRCHRDGTSTDTRGAECFRGMSDARRAIVLWGDSHAAMWRPAAESATAAAPGSGTVQRTMSSCPPLLGITPWISAGGAHAACSRFNARVRDEIIALRRGGLDVAVLLAARWPAYLGEHRISVADRDQSAYLDHSRRGPGSLVALRAGLDSTLSFLAHAGASAAIVLPVPELRYAAPECVLRWGWAASDCGTSRRLHEAYVADVLAIIRDVSRRRPGTTILDPAAHFCDGAVCHAAAGRAVWYVDDDHLSPSGVDRVLQSADAFRWWLLGEGRGHAR